MDGSHWDDDDPFGDPRAHRERDASWDTRELQDTQEPAPSRPSRPRTVIVVGVILVLAVTIAGYVGYRVGSATTADPPTDGRTTSSPTTPPSSSALSPSPPRSSSARPSPDATARSALEVLTVRGRADRSDYNRDRFGQEWADVDRNGCDTRNDVLRRDLDPVEIRPGTQGCLVESGVLDDPYSGEQISFERGSDTSIDVQIDHVVSLSNAWQTGAFAWTDQRREQFANDPLNLLAVDGPLNMQKSDGDAATWLPPDRGYWCDLVARQVAVKAAYGLWVTPPERDAVARILERCPAQELPSADGS